MLLVQSCFKLERAVSSHLRVVEQTNGEKGKPLHSTTMYNLSLQVGLALPWQKAHDATAKLSPENLSSWRKIIRYSTPSVRPVFCLPCPGFFPLLKHLSNLDKRWVNDVRNCIITIVGTVCCVQLSIHTCTPERSWCRVQRETSLRGLATKDHMYYVLYVHAHIALQQADYLCCAKSVCKALLSVSVYSYDRPHCFWWLWNRCIWLLPIRKSLLELLFGDSCHVHWQCTCC